MMIRKTGFRSEMTLELRNLMLSPALYPRYLIGN